MEYPYNLLEKEFKQGAILAGALGVVAGIGFMVTHFRLIEISPDIPRILGILSLIFFASIGWCSAGISQVRRMAPAEGEPVATDDAEIGLIPPKKVVLRGGIDTGKVCAPGEDFCFECGHIDWMENFLQKDRCPNPDCPDPEGWNRLVVTN